MPSAPIIVMAGSSPGFVMFALPRCQLREPLVVEVWCRFNMCSLAHVQVAWEV